MSIEVLKDKCNGCTLCVKSCPFDAIKIIDKLAVIDMEKCTLCGACKDVCKFEAIIITKKETAPEGVSGEYKGVWVFCEQKKGIIQPVSYELLGKGRELADKLNTQLSGVVLGAD